MDPDAQPAGFDSGSSPDRPGSVGDVPAPWTGHAWTMARTPFHPGSLAVDAPGLRIRRGQGPGLGRDDPGFDIGSRRDGTQIGPAPVDPCHGGPCTGHVWTIYPRPELMAGFKLRHYPAGQEASHSLCWIMPTSQQRRRAALDVALRRTFKTDPSWTGASSGRSGRKSRTVTLICARSAPDDDATRRGVRRPAQTLGCTSGRACPCPGLYSRLRSALRAMEAARCQHGR